MKTILSSLFFFFTFSLYGQADSNKIILWATYYYVPKLIHDENGIDLLDENENKLGLKLNSCDWCNASIQGTLFIRKGNINYVLNYAGRSKNLQYDCRLCAKYKQYARYENTGKVLWKLSKGFGKGVKSYNLVPFKTLAVDTSIIPIGAVVYIPRGKGVKYLNPDGQMVEHDGYFFAGDVGSKISGNHIDVFIGSSLENPFDFIQSNQNRTFEAYIVSDKKKVIALRDLHK